MIIYQEFLALNEELPAFDPSERLRYAVHEIMIRLKDGQTIKFTELSKKLKDEFKINIPDDLLKEIFDKWDKFTNADYSIFKKEDENWMDVFAFQGYVKRKSRDKQSFGKHRKKEITTTTNYSNNYTNNQASQGYWAGNRWIPYANKTPKNDDIIWPGYGDYYGD